MAFDYLITLHSYPWLTFGAGLGNYS